MNKIIHGNCLEVMRTMRAKSVSHVFTSPPHNRLRNDKYAEYDDTVGDYFGMLVDAVTQCMRVSRGYTIFNIQKNYYNKNDVLRLLGHFAEQIVEVIVWEKSNPMPAAGKSITNAYEFFIVFGTKPLVSNSTYTKNHITTSVNSKMPKGHKAVMKREVADWFMSNFTKNGETILDPFFGIGTTGAAAHALGRKYIGIEMALPYYLQAKKELKV